MAPATGKQYPCRQASPFLATARIFSSLLPPPPVAHAASGFSLVALTAIPLGRDAGCDPAEPRGPLMTHEDHFHGARAINRICPEDR